MRVEGSLPILAPPERVLALLRDPGALQRMLPGCEGVDCTSPDRFRARIARKVGLLTLRIDPEITIVAGDDGRTAVLTLDAANRIAGSVAARLDLRLEREPLGTRLFWQGEVTLLGMAARMLAGEDQVAARLSQLFQRLKTVAER